MTRPLKIALAQINLLVGDIDGNRARVVEWAHRARDAGAELVIFPELTLCGYPPEDLLLRPGFLRRVETALHQLAGEVVGIDVLVGHPQSSEAGLHNAASLLRDGQVAATYAKQRLPNYGVFDEARHFVPGAAPCVVDVGGLPVGVTICEDLWHPDIVAPYATAGARLLVNLNASPYHAGKNVERETALRERQREAALPILYANLVGGQDELVFDGESFALDASGAVVTRAPAFREQLLLVEVDRASGALQPGEIAAPPSELEGVYTALVTGVRDYVRKNGFSGALLGLSGGIDSALTLAIAVDAIGADNVAVAMMPSRYTADMSNVDALAEAEMLGVEHHVIPIEPAFEAFLGLLEGPFAGAPRDVTEENIQARCRGVLLMALSNKSGRILLTTGNKSEMAVGYATLYGDMAGGFAPLKDVPKTLVYRLAEYRNTLGAVIPDRVIERPPSAELAPDQRDIDSLPDYPLLDAIIERYVEFDQCGEEIIAAGFDAATVHRVLRMIDRNEYKRRQAPPGVRISRKAFGRDRRYPITNGYRPD